ncbi:MAG: MmgE/PrpD family protein [Pseudomonadota bacterium]
MLQTVGVRTGFSDFVLDVTPDDIPPDVRARAQDLVLDLIGVAAAAAPLDASRIGREMALRLFNTPDAGVPMLFDGRTASAAGAAYAGATQIDALDAHDGYSPSKGHAGCGLLPGVLAFLAGQPPLSGADFLTAMVVGYETACRAGVALHGTVTDYHTSGAWVALAVAGLGVRLAGGTPDQLRQAIGIAEYHGPRSQMMREIDNPTMLHDGSGWGAMVGVTSADLALAGFQGAPAVTVEREDAAPYWADLGQTWLTARQNIKLYPICRWAHAQIKAALDLRTEHGVAADQIERIELFGFHEAIRLAADMPVTTAKAQYSISYPVACALHFGRVGTREVSGETFGDPAVADLVARTTLAACDQCNANFPADRLGRTVLVLKDGRRLDSGITRAPGEHTNPIDRDGIIAKFDDLTAPVLSRDRAERIKDTVFALDGMATVGDLMTLIHEVP